MKSVHLCSRKTVWRLFCTKQNLCCGQMAVTTTFRGVVVTGSGAFVAPCSRRLSACASQQTIISFSFHNFSNYYLFLKGVFIKY